MRESEEKGLREKVSLFSGLSQIIIIVCFEMGVPYFKVRQGARPRAMGIFPPRASVRGSTLIETAHPGQAP